MAVLKRFKKMKKKLKNVNERKKEIKV